MNRYPNIRISRLILFFSLAMGIPASSIAKDWPSWRGPSFTGSREDGKYPVKWTSEKAAWKAPLPGKGGSSPIVWKDKIYLSSPADGEDSVIAFNLYGKQLWQTKLGPEKKPKHKKLGSSCNASPVTDGKGIYVYYKSGNFAALEMDGTIRWKQNLTEQYGAEKLFWDSGSSPVLVGDTVVLARLHEGKSWIAAFDRATGKVRWLQPRDYDVPKENDHGYTTPVIFDHEGKKALLVWCSDHLTAHAADSGKVLWSCGGFNPDGTGFWPAISTPVIEGDMIVVPVGRDDRNQARTYGVRLGGKHAWKRDDIGVFVSTPAKYKGKIYLLRHRGGVVCLDPESGKTIWEDAFPKSSATYYSSPVIANGVLYAAREDGVVFTASIDGKFKLLGENAMGEQIIASPVPVADSILLRGAKHLFRIK